MYKILELELVLINQTILSNSDKIDKCYSLFTLSFLSLLSWQCFLVVIQ